MTSLSVRPPADTITDPIEIITAPNGAHPALLVSTAYARLGERPIPLCDPQHQFVSLQHVEGSRKLWGKALSPCSHPGKAPLERAYPRFASETPTQADLLRMFKTHRGNIGGVVPAGRVVLDVDRRSGGLESLERFVRTLGPLPLTPTVLTGGGGFHYHFVLPADAAVNAGGSLADLGFLGMESKGPGAQVVLPPSVHVSGQQYAWEPGCALGDVPLAMVPALLLDLILRAQGRNGVRPTRHGQPRQPRLVQPADVQVYFAALWRTQGIFLQPGDVLYRCPFHRDTDPSLHVDAERCIWNCLGSGCRGQRGGGIRELEALPGREAVGAAGVRPLVRTSGPVASALGKSPFPNSDAPSAGTERDDLVATARQLFPLPKGVTPQVVARVYAFIAEPSKAMRREVISNSWSNPANRALKRRIYWHHLMPKCMAAAAADGLFEVTVRADDWSARRRAAIAAQVRRRGGEYAAFDNRLAAGIVRMFTTVAVPGALPVRDPEPALIEALQRLDLPEVQEKARVHLVWLSKGWALPAHPSKGVMKLIAVREKGDPVDDDAEEAAARQEGIETWLGHGHDVGEWRPPRFFGVPSERVTQVGLEGALDDLLGLARALGYRPVFGACGRIFGNPQAVPKAA